MRTWLTLAFLLTCIPVAPCAEPARISSEMPLAGFARQSVGKEFYGAYLFGSKMGWVGGESRVTEYQGTPVFEITGEIHLEVGRGDEHSRKVYRSTTRYSLEGDGGIISITDSDLEDASETERSAVRDGTNLRITTRESSGKTSERVVPLPRDTLRVQRGYEAWLTAPRRKGDKFTTYDVDLAEEKIDSESVMEYIEPAPLVWGGVLVKASRIHMHLSGPDFVALIGPDGRLLRGKIAGLVEIRAEEEQVAKTFSGAAVDMLAASSIAVNQPLGDRDALQGVTLELSGLGDLRLPDSPRQRIRQAGKGRATVQLTRETLQPATDPLTPEQRALFLRATPSVQKDDPQIRALALQIAGDEADPVRIATRIVEWIGRNLRQTYAADASTATAVLAQKAGDCTEHALLFTALARAAGIPTRQVGGILYVETPAPLFGWHAWAEIHDGRGWISVDPTWHQVRVDPTHVQFSSLGEDADDMSWLQVLGKVKISVKKVDRGG